MTDEPHWTRVAPTVPGWYWLHSPTGIVRAAHVKMWTDRLWVASGGTGAPVAYHEEKPGWLWWSEPLSPPIGPMEQYRERDPAD